MVVKELVETTTDGETMAQRFGVKLFLTNKRLFFLDAELDRGACVSVVRGTASADCVCSICSAVINRVRRRRRPESDPILRDPINGVQ